MPSPLPRSTTLVSPVTIGTPASAQAAAIDATMRRRSSIGKPSSSTKPALRASGSAPHIARSLTVPCTASEPMSPPGKKSRLHDEAVGREGQALAADVEDRAVAELLEGGLRERRQEQLSMSRAVLRPPPPWASCTMSSSSSGGGQASIAPRERLRTPPRPTASRAAP